MRIAIIVGHNPVKQGFFSPYIGLTEYNYHSRVVELLNDVDVYYRKDKGYYSNEIDELCNRLNSMDYDLVLSLHFNSFNEAIQGSEAWVYHSNKESKSIALDYLNSLSGEHGVNSRGVKLVTNINQRGGRLFFKCKHPVILLEPFFGDQKDSLVFKDVEKYAKFLQGFINCLNNH